MDNVQEIFTDKISLPKDNMRQHIDRDSIFELAEDIKKNGLISPITVRPMDIQIRDGVEYHIPLFAGNTAGEKMYYELVAGQRRYLAHQFSGILKIKCIVKNLTDEEAFAIMTSENLARVDVNPIDEAKHTSRLMQMNDDDIKKVAHIVGRSEKWIRDRLAVAQMPDYMQEYLSKKELKLGVALILLQIGDENTRRMWTEQAVRDGVSVAMAEYWLSDYKRQLLPGGTLAENSDPNFIPSAPQAVMFRCAIDGREYDVRLCKSVIIYEGNLQYFNAFVSAFNEAPPETELESGGD